jgi:peptidoglycan hydrolase CwlO-like protein
LKRYEYDVSGPLLELILKQLQKAAADSELLKQIEEEENALHEVEAIQRALVRKLKQRDKELHWKDEELLRKDKELDHSKKELDQSKKELDEKERYIQELEEKLKEKRL